MQPLKASGAIAPVDEKRRLAAFSAARRHSAFVRVLRVGIAAVLAGGAAGALYTLKAPSSSFHFQSVSVTGDGKILMESPVMTGARSDGSPYRVSARETAQSADGKGDMDMRDVSATVKTAQAVLDVTSKTGVYSKASDRMRLQGGVVFTTSTRARLTSDEAVIGFKDSSLHATGSPVVTVDGRITASDVIDVMDGGDKVVFTGHVESLIPAADVSDGGTPSDGAAPSPPTTGQPEGEAAGAPTLTGSSPGASAGFTRKAQEPSSPPAAATEAAPGAPTLEAAAKERPRVAPRRHGPPAQAPRRPFDL